MASYQSVGQLNTKFTPQFNYVAPPAAVPNPALKGNKAVDVSSVFKNYKPTAAGYITPKLVGSALGNAINQTVLKPAVAIPKSVYDIGRGAVASGSIPGTKLNPTALANANKAKATDEPQVLSPVARPLIQVARTIEHPLTANSFTPTSNSAKRVFGNTPVQNIAAGVKSTAKTHGGLAGALYGVGQVGQDVTTLAAIKGVGEGEGAVGATRNGIKSAKQAFIDGPKQTLNNSITHVALQAGEKANTPVKIPVGGEEGATAIKVRTPVHAGIKDVSSTTKIGVRTPLKPGIKQISSTDKIGVRTPNQMSDADFTSEFNKLSKGYERDTGSLEKFSKGTSPQETQATSDRIDSFYHGKINDLLDRYHNPELSSPTKPTNLAKSTSSTKTTGGFGDVPKPRTLATAITKARNYGGDIPAPRRPRSALDPLVEQAEAADKVAQTAQTAQAEPSTTTTVETPQTAPESSKSYAFNDPQTGRTTYLSEEQMIDKHDALSSIPATERTATQATQLGDIKRALASSRKSTAGQERVSGSSLRTQQEAVEAGMKSEADNTGATFTTVSHKDEAAKAVDLVQNDPEKAMDIAMGRKSGDNASHESAVYHAVKNAEIAKAQKTGDWTTVTDLANSQRHTGVSEAAQKLGAEGYNVDPHDPISIMNDVAKTRAQASEEKGAPSLTKATAEIKTAVKAESPKITRQSWSDFIDGLKC